jgi:hypothetical protein
VQAASVRLTPAADTLCAAQTCSSATTPRVPDVSCKYQSTEETRDERLLLRPRRCSAQLISALLSSLRQNDLYKFMKTLHADNRNTAQTADSTGRLSYQSLLTLAVRLLLPVAVALFPKDIVIEMAAQLESMGQFDYSTFRLMTRRYPMLFYPFTRIQLSMRRQLITSRLFEALDARTGDIYHERRGGDRARLYHLRKTVTRLRMLAMALCGCCCKRAVREEEMEKRRERREAIKREKAEVKRRRVGGVDGELWQEKKAEMDFLRMRRRATQQARLRRGQQPADEDDDEEEEELPSAVRRKYFGADTNLKEDDPERIRKIVQKLRDVVNSVRPTTECHCSSAMRCPLSACLSSPLRCYSLCYSLCRMRWICSTATT